MARPIEAAKLQAWHEICWLTDMTGLPEQAQNLILLVEGDRDYAFTIETNLISKNFKVITVSDVTDGIFKARNQKFECILLDLQASMGTGETFLNKIRNKNTELNFQTPVIVISKPLEQEVLGRIANRIQGVLVKPFSPIALVEKIRGVVSQISETN